MCREFVDLGKSYYEKCERRGKLVRINYNSNPYNEDNALLDKDALVYLPYNYDESDKKTYFEYCYKYIYNALPYFFDK